MSLRPAPKLEIARSPGGRTWQVQYLDGRGVLEGGFFSKDAAISSKDEWERMLREGGRP